jgi:hypothetical protein
MRISSRLANVMLGLGIKRWIVIPAGIDSEDSISSAALPPSMEVAGIQSQGCVLT